MIYRGICLSDLHFGHPSLTNDKMFLQTLIKVLDDESSLGLDFIFICGDLFDRKLVLSDQATSQLTSFLKKLAIISSNGCPIRMIYGTQSHECNQYSGIFKLFDDGCDIIVYQHVHTEEVLKDLVVTFIPEEYTNIRYPVFYKEQLENIADIGIYHGDIDGISNKIFHDNRMYEDIKYSKVVSLESEFLSQMARYVYSGHYHIASSIRDNVKYIGSFWRWQQGEDQDKGYYRLTYNTLSKICTDEFISSNAPIFHTMIVDESNPIENVKQYLKSHENTGKISVKVVFDSIDDFQRIKSELQAMDKGIKISPIYIGSISSDHQHSKYIFDASLSLSGKIAMFIQENNNYTIPEDKIQHYIYTKEV